MAAVAAELFLTPSQRKVLKRLERNDTAFKRSVSHWDAAAAAITGTSTDSGVRVLARGRVHARQNMKDVDKWRDAAVEHVLGDAHDPTTSSQDACSQTQCSSPTSLWRKYGNRQPRLRPIDLHRRLAVANAPQPVEYNGTATHCAAYVGRAEMNMRMRAHVWKEARLTSICGAVTDLVGQTTLMVSG
jgi:hypothetical protein